MEKLPNLPVGQQYFKSIRKGKDRNYAASLRLRNKPITGVGVVFSAATKGVAVWDKAEL